MEPISDDLKELIGLFKSNNVEFLIVGAHALAFHGFARPTYALDLWIWQNQANVKCVIAALNEFGLSLSANADSEFLKPRAMLVMGLPPHQVDILGFLDGCQFKAAWEKKVSGNLAGVEVSYISAEDLIASKLATGRPRDLMDVDRLKEILGAPTSDEPSGDHQP